MRPGYPIHPHPFPYSAGLLVVVVETMECVSVIADELDGVVAVHRQDGSVALVRRDDLNPAPHKYKAVGEGHRVRLGEPWTAPDEVVEACQQVLALRVATRPDEAHPPGDAADPR